MNSDQTKVIEYLAEAGWIERIWESESNVTIQWTPEGIKRLTALNEIFEEVTYDLMKNRPDQFAFFGLLVRLAGFVGSDDNRVTVLGRLNPNNTK